MTKTSRTLFGIGLMGLLGACAVSSPLQVRSTGSGGIAPSAVALDIADSGSGSTRADYAAALGAAFAKNDVGLDPAAPVIAEYAFSISDAREGILAANQKPATAGTSTDWDALPREKRRFDKCDAKRMRGTLVLFDKARGEMVYRGSASQIECNFGERDIASLADQLVADALGGSGN